MRPAAPRTDHTHVLLLRGIDVGRSNRVGKDTLTRWAQAASGEAVTTHLASGSVLFRASSDAAAEGVRQGFARRAREEGGLDVPVVLVGVGTLRRALELHDALPGAGGDPKRTQLTVLEDDPAPEAAAALAALDHGDDRPAGPDRTALGGRRPGTDLGGRHAGRPATSTPAGHREPADESPSCSAQVIVAHEVSGSATVYEVNPVRGRGALGAPERADGRMAACVPSAREPSPRP